MFLSFSTAKSVPPLMNTALSAGMRIKGKDKKHSPLPPRAPPIHRVLFFLEQNSVFLRFFLTEITSERRIHSTNTNSCPHSTFSLQPETNLFGKLRAVQTGTTHSLRAFNCWGQADTHSNTLTHSHKMAALTKISSTPKAAYELNYGLTSEHSRRYLSHILCVHLTWFEEQHACCKSDKLNNLNASLGLLPGPKQ